eukprot:277128-Chlamydomonas_euryale.AAC.1
MLGGLLQLHHVGSSVLRACCNCMVACMVACMCNGFQQVLARLFEAWNVAGGSTRGVAAHGSSCA